MKETMQTPQEAVVEHHVFETGYTQKYGAIALIDELDIDTSEITD